MQSTIDHLVITAPTLDSGIRFVERTLGCPMQSGGRHARMGTYNALLKIGPQCYLEVIAIDPAAAPAARPRWFELDSLKPDSSPRLATWVVRTTNIQQASRSTELDPGAIEEMSRGTLDWRITIPADGQLPCGGVAPALIEWTCGTHPVSQMQESSVQLIQLSGCHPEASRIRRWLSEIDFSSELPLSLTESSVGSLPGLSAVFQTPRGIVTLAQ